MHLILKRDWIEYTFNFSHSQPSWSYPYLQICLWLFAIQNEIGDIRGNFLQWCFVNWLAFRFKVVNEAHWYWQILCEADEIWLLHVHLNCCCFEGLLAVMGFPYLEESCFHFWYHVQVFLQFGEDISSAAVQNFGKCESRHALKAANEKSQIVLIRPNPPLLARILNCL